MKAAALERIDLPVSGMTCAACARTIERALSGAGGVESARVNLATHTATIEYDPSRVRVGYFVQSIEDLGYGVPKSAADSAEPDYLRRFIVAASLAAPVLVLAMAHGALRVPYSPWIQLALTLPVVLYSGAPFYIAAYRAARHGAANMNSLISLGTGAAFLYSLYETVRGGHEVYFEAAGAIIALVLCGRMLEARARGKASAAIRGLMDLQPPAARVVRDGAEIEIPAGQLAVGDIVIVRPGERIPADGKVIEGESAVDESMLTGESMPVDKAPGALVYAGCINREGAIRFRATAAGGGSVLQRMIEMVKQAQGSRAPVARLADVVSGYFTFGVLAAALLTFAVRLFLEQPFATAMVNAVAVIVIACPCALGLATPVAIMVGTGRAAERGIFIKGGEALEMARRIDVILLDKTGTITMGKPRVTRIAPAPAFTQTELLRLTASAERLSEHPLGRAIVEKAAERGITLAETSGFSALPGHGVRATVEGREVFAGRAEGRPGVAVSVDGVEAGVIEIADTIRPEAAEAVRRLRAMGLEVAMITGDNRVTAEAVARQAGIDRVLAEVLPEAKAREVERLQAEGKRVAMVGDGINDAPALARADLGIAMGAGTDIAMEASDITLMRPDLNRVADAIALSRRTMRIIRQNLFWAFAYNTLGIPAAALGLLSPVLASAAMALSSVTVVTNSLRLK